MTVSLIPGTLEAIRATPSVLQALLGDVPADVAATTGPEGWSPRDVVAHLVVAGRLGALDRASRAVGDEGASFAGYDEESELDASGLRGEPVAVLLRLLEAERGGCLVLTRTLEGDDLARSGVHEDVGRVTVAELLHQTAYHDSLHIAQIASLLSASFMAGRGALATAQS